MPDAGDAPTVRLDGTDPLTVRVHGERFTAYRPDGELPKPVLFPIEAPCGAPVTRGYPLDTRPTDRRDHPHQVGSWFTYGDVNGLDFWNHSAETPAERADEMGTIRHRALFDRTERGSTAAFTVRCDWCGPDGSVLLEETTRFTVRARPGARVLDRSTTLVAPNGSVEFRDNKEGLFGLRVARPLELRVEADLTFTDAAGVETVVRATGDHEVTGTYRSSEARVDDETWGTRAEWLSLSGRLDGTDVTLAVFDHPENPGYPTYWMARPYGLFAANPLGRAAFDGPAEPMAFTVDDGDSATFRYRLLVSETDPDPDRLDATFDRFVDAVA